MEIVDQHVEALNLEDEPDLVVIQVYITSAYRSYRLAEHYRRIGSGPERSQGRENQPPHGNTARNPHPCGV